MIQEAMLVWKKVASVSPTAKSSLRLDVKKLERVHPALQRMVFRMAFEHLKGDLNQLNFDHVILLERLMGDPSGAVDLPGEITVKKTKEHLLFLRRLK